MSIRTALAKIFLAPPYPLEELEASTVQASLPSHADWLQWANYYPINVASALSLPGVFRANVLLADLSGQIDWYQERQVPLDGGGTRWERVDSPYPLVRQPNLDEPVADTITAGVSKLATEGEGFFVLGGHDPQGNPHTAQVIPDNGEVEIQWSADRLRPEYKWRGRRMRLWRDIAHTKHLAIPGKLHALGPIQAYAQQLLGSGTVEEWARTWFETGGATNTTISVPGELDTAEATEIKNDWISAHGAKLEPAVLFGGAVVANDEISPDKAQALETRRWNVQMAASMYGLNPYMLAVAMSGANITYQTLPDLFAEAIRLTVYPSYLRKHETLFTQLLPRGNRVRFDLSEFLRADEKTRMETASIGIDAGVQTADEWRIREGLKPRKEPANAPTQ